MIIWGDTDQSGLVAVSDENGILFQIPAIAVYYLEMWILTNFMKPPDMCLQKFKDFLVHYSSVIDRDTFTYWLILPKQQHLDIFFRGSLIGIRYDTWKDFIDSMDSRQIPRVATVICLTSNYVKDITSQMGPLAKLAKKEMKRLHYEIQPQLRYPVSVDLCQPKCVQLLLNTKTLFPLQVSQVNIDPSTCLPVHIVNSFDYAICIKNMLCDLFNVSHVQVELTTQSLIHTGKDSCPVYSLIYPHHKSYIILQPSLMKRKYQLELRDTLLRAICHIVPVAKLTISQYTLRCASYVKMVAQQLHEHYPRVCL